MYIFLSVVFGTNTAVVVPSSGRTCIPNPANPSRRGPVAHPGVFLLSPNDFA